MQDETFDSTTKSYATPSSSRSFHSGTSTPSTWMTDQRNRRMIRRGYGRRFSRTNGGFGEEGGLSREMDQEDFLDCSANGRLQGNGAEGLDGAARAGLEGNEEGGSAGKNRYPARRLRSNRSSGDLNESVEEQEAKAKKKRPNIPRSGKPPLPSKAAGKPDTRAKTNYSRSFSTSDADLSTPKPAAPTPLTRRRALQRSQSVECRNSSAAASNAAASAARMLEENVHPNDSRKMEKSADPPEEPRRTRSTKKRTASITGIAEIKASPPKMPNRKTCNSFSSSSFSSGGEESFSNLAKRETPSWGHKRSFSQSYGCKTPAAEHQRSHTIGSEDWKVQPMFLSPTLEEGKMLATPLVGTANRGMGFSARNAATPSVCEMLSPPLFGGIDAEISMVGPDLEDGTMDVARDIVDSDNETLSSRDDDSVDSSSTEESVEAETLRDLTDSEIFDSKPSYEDFKFLVKSLVKWSHSNNKNGRGATMGLNNGCVIAVPKHWEFEHKANFMKWASEACGFRISTLGKNAGSYLRCVDSEGSHILERLRRILKEHKAGRLGVVLEEKTEEIDTGVFSPGAELVARARSKLSPSYQPSITPANQRKALTAFPFCEETEEDQLANAFRKRVNIDKKKEKHGMGKLPGFMRSISLQPLTRGMKSPLPFMRSSPPSDRKVSRLLRLSSESAMHDQSRISIDSDRKLSRPPAPPRLSSESTMNGTDFLNQIHGASPLSPIAHVLPRRFRRTLNPKRPSLEKPCLSFDNSVKPFESPHPRNNCLLQNTPLPRVDFESERPWETPMPKQVEHWGSRPIVGKDWGVSACCDNSIINCCARVFAQSWFTSDFYNNETLSDGYKMSFPDDEQSALQEHLNSDSDIEHEDNFDAFSNNLSPKAPPQRKLKLHREDSVGGSALALLHLDDKKDTTLQPKHPSRRSLKLRKYRRMSLCAAAASEFLHPKRCPRLSTSPKKQLNHISPEVSVLNEISSGPILSTILSFFDQSELLDCVMLVCTSWADAAAEALGSLVIASVGCDPSFLSSQINDDVDDDMETPRGEAESIERHQHISSVAKSMERDWSYFRNFPTGVYLSQGAFKKVYKVWNNHIGAYEALSVMDVDTISETGNLHTVGAELAVSMLLSSIARRNIAPNFVITRGVFTCQYDLPATDWDVIEDDLSAAQHGLEQGECGNFQYIRMELCKHKDVEDYIRNLPTKMLAPVDCRNLLFQMAFALHVASDKLGMKHYDVKLLNFFLQSALKDSTPEDLHPHVVLRYGVGSSVFRLRMDPSNAFIVKLADYGTSVLRTDSDGQPISLGQFTTFENTPPDYLILGNDAEQGYGHDCFGLGLSMLHLFTGHDPYEEILVNVVCPNELKTKLRKIWNGDTHDIISSAMMYEGPDGTEVEDETFYNTLYRFLVLFGIPKRRFQYKENGKVWRAVSSCLLKDGPDAGVFESDRKIYSLADGNNDIIANARRRLEEMDGAMELLLSLVCFDPSKRATPLDVINSRFMEGLIEHNDDDLHDDQDVVRSYMSYYTTS